MNNLKKIRGKHGLSIVELSKQCNMTKQSISVNEKKCSVFAAKKVSELLNEDIFDILGEDVLKVLPKTQEQKNKLLAIVENIQIAKE